VTIHAQINGNPATVTVPDPGGQTRIRGRVWRWEYVHGFLVLVRADGEPMSLKAWPGDKHPLWRAVRRWEKRNGRRMKR
jgi:hypothetical protein